MCLIKSALVSKGVILCYQDAWYDDKKIVHTTVYFAVIVLVYSVGG
jgi:hypothetical protein